MLHWGGNGCTGALYLSRTRDSNIFKVSINVAARSKIDFNLTYQELLQRKLGVYQNLININPGQVVRDMRIEVDIRESREITVLRVPPIREDVTQVIDPDVGENLSKIFFYKCQSSIYKTLYLNINVMDGNT